MGTEIIAVDPGNTKSGMVHFEVDNNDIYGIRMIGFNGSMDNEDLLDYVSTRIGNDRYIAIETPKPQGMALAGETMETLIFIGRLCESIDLMNSNDEALSDWTYVFRPDVKLHLCGQSRAKDKNVSQAIRDRHGGCQKPVKCSTCKGRGKSGRGKERQPCADCDSTGLEKIAGPLHGLSNHAWQAMGVGLWFLDNKLVQRRIINPGGRDNRDPGITKVSFD